MKIFITGIAGFLGSHLAKRMIEKGHSVSGNDNLIGGDIWNLPDGAEFFELDCNDLEAMTRVTEGVDLVYHCAATAHEGLSVFSPTFICNNIYQASVSTITAAVRNKVKKFIYCSSMSRYGDQECPFTEDMPTKPVDPYGISKVAGEEALKVLGKVHNMDWNIAVPHNIVGPNQKYDDPFRNVMSIMINRNLSGKPAIIYGDGEQKRCFSYIEDVLFCLEALALKDEIKSEIINVGPDEEYITINQLAEMVAAVTGFEGEPIYYPKGRPQEVIKATCSSDKARKLLGYKTETSLLDSIVSTTKFIKQRGVKPFDYTKLPVEILNDKTPETWSKRTI